MSHRSRKAAAISPGLPLSSAALKARAVRRTWAFPSRSGDFDELVDEHPRLSRFGETASPSRRCHTWPPLFRWLPLPLCRRHRRDRSPLTSRRGQQTAAPSPGIGASTATGRPNRVMVNRSPPNLTRAIKSPNPRDAARCGITVGSDIVAPSWPSRWSSRQSDPCVTLPLYPSSGGTAWRTSRG